MKQRIKQQEIAGPPFSERIKKYSGVLFRGILIFVITWIVLVGLLCLVAKIPQSAIYDNTLESARYLTTKEVFFNAYEGIDATRIDRYADSILVSIVYHLDGERVLQSVAESSYYYTAWQNENDNLLDSVEKGLEANQQYLRYWHGSIVFLRPLLLLFSIRQIYIFHGVVLAGLFLIFLCLLLCKKAYSVAIGSLIGAVMIWGWLIPMSLEYTWMFLLTLLASILVVVFEKKLQNITIYLFLVIGMLASFLDFLTTETLTLTMPLLLFLYFQKKEELVSSKKSMLPFLLKNALAWGVGYCGMWISKWIFARMVLQRNVWVDIGGHVGERLIGETRYQIDVVGFLSGSVLRNLGALFPLPFGKLGTKVGVFGIIVCFFSLVIMLYLCYVFCRDTVNKVLILGCLLIGAIPYLRFLVLLNHSYLHYFFTQRAQWTVCVCVAVIVGECLDLELFLKRGKNRKSEKQNVSKRRKNRKRLSIMF